MPRFVPQIFPIAAAIAIVVFISFFQGDQTSSIRSEGKKTESLPERKLANVAKTAAPTEEEKAKTIAAKSTPPEAKSLKHWENILKEVPASTSKKAILSLFSSRRGDRIQSVFPFNSPALVNMSFRHGNNIQTVGLKFIEHPEVTVYLKKEADGSISGRVSRSGAAKAIEMASEKANESISLTVKPVEDLICANTVGGSIREGMLEPRTAAEADESAQAGHIPTSEDVPLLESRPGASNTIYLNFVGETVAGTAWNTHYNNGNPIVAEAYGDAESIEEIWELIAADYRAFDVNVTTDRSTFDNTPSRNRCMAIFTPTKSWFGNAGGVAYLNSFGDSTEYMCWVFNSSAKSAAEAGSHEVGHQVGLSHDGSTNSSYYSGHRHSGTGIKWAPIMGSSYSSTISQFSRGEYEAANETEDDLAIIESELGSIHDDFADTPANASPPEGSDQGIINVPGLIGVGNDVDVFQFPVSNPGSIKVTAFPTANYTNLDLKIEIRNETGGIVASSAPEASFSASVETETLEIGNYFLVVSGDSLGTTANGYSSYGSIGGYHLSGECPPTAAATTPGNFSATDGSRTDYVELSWEAVNYATEYRVYRKPDGLLSSYTHIATTTENSYRDSSAVLDQVYTYYVRAANPLGESEASPEDTGFRQNLPATPEEVTATDGSSTRYTRIEWSSVRNAEKYSVFRSPHPDGSGEIKIAEVIDTEFDDSTGLVESQYFYSVRAVNAAGTSEKSSLVTGSRAAAYASPGSISTESHEGGVLVRFNRVSGSNSYTIFRGTGNNSEGAVAVGTVESNEFYDTSASSGRNYSYYVRANGPSGNSVLSSGSSGSRSGATPGDDIFEANDRIEEAFSIQSFEGKWLGSRSGTAKALDEDWYSIIPREGTSRIDIILSPRSATSQIGFNIRGEDGEIIAEAAFEKNGSILSLRGIDTGSKYYIVVGAVESGDAGYNLLWTSSVDGQTSGQADLSIGKTRSSNIGAFIYEAHAKRQKVTRSVRGRRKTRNYATATNKSVEEATLVATGSRKNRKATFTYFAQIENANVNVTAAMARGGVHTGIAPLESLKMQVCMRASRSTARRGKKVTGNFRTQFLGESNSDSGRFNYRVRKSRK